MITSGALGAGSRLPIEKYLAGELGVSRRSLREGCAPWCIMGVLEARQGEVTYVTSLEPSLLLVPMSFMADLHAASDSSHLRSVRRVLETEAAGSAALTIDKDALAEAEAILTSVEPLVNSLAETDYEAIMVADIAFHRVSTAPPGMIGRPISWARRMTALEKPELTRNRAPASAAASTWSGWMMVPAPTSMFGFWAMAAMDCTAATVRKVTSATGNPPAYSASESGTVSAGSSTTTTGMMRRRGTSDSAATPV
jgi:hypothetical protein